MLGEVHLERGESQAAHSALKRSLRILVDLHSEYEAAKTKLSLARLALKTGKSVNRKELDQAIQTFQKLGAQVDLADALQIEDEL